MYSALTLEKWVLINFSPSFSCVILLDLIGRTNLEPTLASKFETMGKVYSHEIVDER